MKPTAIKFILLAILSMAFTACTSVPPEILGGSPGGMPLVQVGGQLTLTAPNGVTVDVNNEKSFEDLNRTINTLGTGYILASAQKAIEAGKRAVESDGIKAATEQARIDSTTTLGVEKEKTARMMIEPPPVVPVAPPATP
jgi:hypothetical protein